jgi:hypothetical protein
MGKTAVVRGDWRSKHCGAQRGALHVEGARELLLLLLLLLLQMMMLLQ